MMIAETMNIASSKDYGMLCMAETTMVAWAILQLGHVNSTLLE
jgi:hypothetical protein